MTVSTTAEKDQYTLTGAGTAFAFTFKIFAETELVVIREDTAGVETTLTLTTDYTVSASPWETGGTVTTITNYTDGILTIKRALPRTQTKSYTTASEFPAATHEEALDRAIILIQELEEKLSRALILKESTTLSDLALPDPGAGNYLRWAADGLSIEAVSATVNNDSYTSSETGAVERTVMAKISDFLSVKDFGALGDGATDDTAAFNLAIGAITTSGSVIIPAGDYVVDIDGLTYGSKVVNFIQSDDATLNGSERFPQLSIRDGTNGTTKTIDVDITTGYQGEVYSVIGDMTGTGKLFCYRFDITADSTTSSNEAVRGVIGRITGEGAGEYKAIRVGATDGGSGASSIMGISADVRPVSGTTNAYVAQFSEQAAASTNDKATGIYFDQTNSNRWANGIVFDQGMEVNDAWVQASISSAGSPSGRFLKLKDTAGTPAVIFEVDNTGRARSTNGIYGGEYTNGIKVGQDTIERTAAGGNLVVKAGTTSGQTLTLNAGSSNQIVISDDGVAVGAVSRQGSGTLAAQALFSGTAAIRNGTGTPESAVTGNVGDLFLRTDGGASTTLYVKESGTGNTGWVAK